MSFYTRHGAKSFQVFCDLEAVGVLYFSLSLAKTILLLKLRGLTLPSESRGSRVIIDGKRFREGGSFPTEE
ncbi:hypothetical protein ING2E5A_0790 [Petrimonas mucosa]|uniref:Uncharacterized protein n=1 Tax=Petrimonas mucosa TaxID=1642646 RepID=A0A1G4G501_9BACT|nr:hypothetical protein ING2E5A_0790 [Petrimonas mucosa]